MSSFPESPLPTAEDSTAPRPERRTLGDIHAPRPTRLPVASSALATPPPRREETTDTRNNPVSRPLSPGLQEAIRTIAIAAIDDLVEKRIDARLASFREELVDREGMPSIHKQDRRSRSIREEIGASIAPPTYQDTVYHEASTTSTRAQDPIQQELEKARMDLFLERQRTSTLSEQLNVLTSQKMPAIMPQDRFGNRTNMTGVPQPATSFVHPSHHTGIDQRFRPPLADLASSTTGVPSAPIQLGPPHFGLEEIKPADPEFGPVLSYRRYRLQNTDAEIGPSVSRYVGEHVKLFQPTLKNRKFDGSIPIAILDFLSAFKKTCDEHGVTEGLALLILPNFLEGDVRALVDENFELSGIGIGGFRTWPEAIQLLLMNYAKDAHIKDAMREFQNCAMRDSEDEMAYGRRLQKLARLCGGVVNSQKLVTKFCDGLPPYIQPMVLEVVPSLPKFNRYQTCVDKAAAIGATQRAVLSQATQLRKPSRSDRPKTTRVNQVTFSPSSYRDIGDQSSTYGDSTVLQVGVNESSDLSQDTDSDASFHTAAPARLSSNLVAGSVPAQPTDDDTIPVDALGYDRRYQQRRYPPQRNLPSDICFYCFATGHRQPNCQDANRPRHDPHFQRRLYDNYVKLTDQQKEYLHSVNRAPLLLPTPAVQHPQATPTVASSLQPLATTPNDQRPSTDIPPKN